jgi:GAF domain/ANTAR domain
VVEPDRWTRLLAEAAADRDAQPRRICELCVEMLGVTGASLAAVSDTGHRGVLFATDETSSRIEELQLTLGEGPCMDAISSDAPVLVPDLDQPENIDVRRWPAFAAAAAEAGVRSVFAFPLRIGAIRLGALDLYCDHPRPLEADQLRGALLAAHAGALAVLHLDHADHEHFLGADDGRPNYAPQVHQATGMVKVQLGISVEDAFLLLRARAFASERPLHEIASDVVARRLRFSTEDL